MKARRFLHGPPATVVTVVGITALVAAARYLPAHGIGLWVKLLVVGNAVLLLPGALIVRAIDKPTSLALAAAGSIVWSLLAVFVALSFTFLVDGSLSVTIVGLLAIAVIALAVGFWRNRPPRPGEASPAGRRLSIGAEVGVLAAGIAFGVIVMFGLPDLIGDGPEHASRALKLAQLGALTSPGVADQFRGAGLDPGYAFPLWHAFLALVARLANADVVDVLHYLPPVLCPLSFLVLYGAGSLLFGAWSGGVATLSAEVARMGLAFATDHKLGGAGWFAYLTWPSYGGSILILVPALLALVFAYTATGHRIQLLSIGAGSFVLTIIHPSYAPFVAIPVFGFLVARAWLERADRQILARVGVSLVTLLLASLLFFAWLLPVLRGSANFTPKRSEYAPGFAHYGNQLDRVGRSSFRLAPEFVTAGSGGALAIAALLALPAAAFASRRPWAAYVLGGSLLVLALGLVPPLFDKLSQFTSISQTRRLAAFFLPWSFAIAGAIVVLSRLKVIGVAVVVISVTVLRMFYAADWSSTTMVHGPAWPVWFGVLGGLATLIVGRFVKPRGSIGDVSPAWTVGAACGLLLPFLVIGVFNLKHLEDRRALPPDLVSALRAEVRDGDVLLSTPLVSYRIEAVVPVYVVAVPRGHVRATVSNHPTQRRGDVARFFSDETPNIERRAILRKYGVNWIVLHRSREGRKGFFGRRLPVYEDKRYALYAWRPGP